MHCSVVRPMWRVAAGPVGAAVVVADGGQLYVGLMYFPNRCDDGNNEGIRMGFQDLYDVPSHSSYRNTVNFVNLQLRVTCRSFCKRKNYKAKIV